MIKLAESAKLPEEKRNYFAQLNNLYTGVRYPGEEVDEVENLDQMLDSVEEVVEWTRKQLKK